MTTTDRRELQRALDMERGLLAAGAQRSERHPLGLLLFDAARPRVWVHNQLHVMGPAGDIDDLIRVLDEHYGHLEHRRVVVEDEVEGERLAEGFRSRGWAVDVVVYMALTAERDRDPDAELAIEVDAAAHQEVDRATLAEQKFGRDREVREMLIDARTAHQEAADSCRLIAGVVDGRHVGAASLFVQGAVAQVEDVATLEAYRGRGVARAMVSLAIDLAGDAELIWIAADDEDWPKELYAKLGFRPIGRTFSFTRARV